MLSYDGQFAGGGISPNIRGQHTIAGECSLPPSSDQRGMISLGSETPILFPPEYRASGVLLHLTSLPSRYGIGDAGPEAYRWVDALVEAGQRWWQLLPLGPTGLGNSPYQSPSTFASNETLVSPELLIEDGLLTAADCEPADFPAAEVDYEAVIPFKSRLMDRAWENYRRQKILKAEFEAFCHGQRHWLDDFALFMALKQRHGTAAYYHWPRELVERRPAALTQARSELAEQIEMQCFRQFLVLRQWKRLRAYAHGKGLRLMGDLPIFVSDDSADVWAHPDLFLLDHERRPRVVAGVPPDYFSPTGQLWGNPIYDWESLRAKGYRWWIDRLRAVLAEVDAIRLDHFRAFDAAWHVPAGAETAETGQWVPGPADDFLAQLRQSLGGLPLVAEDLGMITNSVRELRDRFDLPGMRVLQFAFDGMPDNPFLPEHYITNTVVYTGTHDNDTTRSWYETLPTDQRQRLWKVLERPPGNGDEVAWELIRLAHESVAALSILPLQDLLNLAEGRMNMPGVALGNWRWRFTAEMPVAEALSRLGELTERTSRSGQA